MQILTGPRAGWVKHGRSLIAWQEGSKITVGAFPVVMVGAQLELVFFIGSVVAIGVLIFILLILIIRFKT